MSVRRKALCFSILVAGVTSIAGCAIGRVDSPLVASPEGSAEINPMDMEAAPTDLSNAAIEPTITSPDDDVAAVTKLQEQTVLETEEVLTKTAPESMGISIDRGDGFSRVSLAIGSDEPDVDVMTLSNPSRLVVDVMGKPSPINQNLALQSDEFVNAIRLGSHSDRLRIVFDLNELAAVDGLNHQIDTNDGELTITFVDPALLTALAQENAMARQAEVVRLEEIERQAELARLAEIEEQRQAELAAVEEQRQAELAAVEEQRQAELAAVEEQRQAELAKEMAEAEKLAEQRAQLSPEETIASSEEMAMPEEETGSLNPDGTLNLVLEELRFDKTAETAGQVIITLNDRAAFELKKTAPSEYVLTLPGAKANQQTTFPQIAPKGVPGIRSVRAVERGNSTLVRMFVDAQVDIQAVPRGSEIVIQARRDLTANNSEARAQLGGEGLDTAQLNPTGIRSADGSKIYTGRLISLDLQDTDIDNALRIIAEVSNLNIIASDDVTGKVTLRLIDVPWDQALDVILKTNGLDQVTEGNVIRIAPIDKLRQEREALREAKRAAESLEDLTVKYVRISYARATEMLDQVQSVLSERGTVAEDERTNQLIIKDIKKGHDQSLELIKRLDLRTPQVLLETQIVEGSRSIMRTLGFNWNFNFIQSPETGNATGLNFPNSVETGGVFGQAPEAGVGPGGVLTALLNSADGSRLLQASLDALEEEGKAKVISRPQITTVNNKTAEIQAVETVRVRLPDSGTSVATGSGAQAQGGGRTAFEEINVGIELTVTPQASPDYYVLLDVDAESSTFSDRDPVDGIPGTFERKTTSTILVKSGQTFALGGVYRIEDNDAMSGTAFLKDIPVLGALFRDSRVIKSDEELIFFITPHIVEGSFDASLM